MATQGIEQPQRYGGEAYGVLLYYKYATIPDLQQLLNFYRSNCTSLSLVGRVRLSPYGVNVTVGGKLCALEEHISAVKLNSLFEGTDFKLASCHEPLDDRVAKECGFTSLSIRIVKELVTLSSFPLPKSAEVSDAGRHLSAVEFHSVLSDAGNIQDERENRTVLLDARNLYETRIGKFSTPNVETLDPEIRQYSDLPSWIDNNAEKLQGKNILMYCTGGIRCEMASAYIKSKGAGFENVFQLYGGIQRYMEQFPDGGFFKGKNFVFDHRVSVGSLDSKILGTCLLCNSSFDDYSSRTRCMYCRMLVLICKNCQDTNSFYACELCQKNGRNVDSVLAMKAEKSVEISEGDEPEAVSTLNKTQHLPIVARQNGTHTPRRLRILCLHGFRQNASGFKGRTASLAKKLKNIAELVFIDAPHVLPFIYQLRPPEQNCNHTSSSSSLSKDTLPTSGCNRKFAWLVGCGYTAESNSDWKIADCTFDSLQYQQQTKGFDRSLSYLKTTFSEAGPFDGILGFSQGAAMAALLCAHKEKLKGELDFRFAILCSGFAVNMDECQQGSINCPSLHIFCNDKGNDRQIKNQASRRLASMFDDGCSVVIEHDFGHIIPTQSPFIDQIKDFLHRFL
ncbi:rhodanese-like domain-containing protein 6 [Ipomoea triloba]|uniref:rhodanese-like domain-containing protein 6 n=1 Tax=Ipomoea triloba TaxID=35885 RepID=UPI00125E568D|nr:rhodanese-like domain-containing protein 6 [Ipomoea triloba]